MPQTPVVAVSPSSSASPATVQSASKKRKTSSDSGNASAITTSARPAGPALAVASASPTVERSSAASAQDSSAMSTSTSAGGHRVHERKDGPTTPRGVGLAVAGAATIEQGSPPPPTIEDQIEANIENGQRDMVDGDEEGPAATEGGAVPSEEDGSRVGPAAAAALAATAIPPISNGSLRADAGRSGCTSSGGGGGAAAAGGATGEKAVHPSPAEETAVLNRRDGGTPASAVGWEIAVAAAAKQKSPPSSSVSGKVKHAGPGETKRGNGSQGEGWECRFKPAAAATTAADASAERKEKHELVAAAEAWCGAEASSLKRDAQQAKKRSWDEFENDSGSRGRVFAAGVRSATSVVSRSGNSNSNSSSSTSGNGVLKNDTVRKTGTGWQPRDKSLPPGAAGSSPATPAPSASGVCRPPGAPEIMPVADDERREAVADTPEVAAARAALEKAEALVGVDLPSLDKGPPDAEADCILCHVPRGAFLRAERGTKGFGWCHCLCAFSKGLLIENRVVKVCGANQEAIASLFVWAFFFRENSQTVDGDVILLLLLLL